MDKTIALATMQSDALKAADDSMGEGVGANDFEIQNVMCVYNVHRCVLNTFVRVGLSTVAMSYSQVKVHRYRSKDTLSRSKEKIVHDRGNRSPAPTYSHIHSSNVGSSVPEVGLRQPTSAPSPRHSP